MTEELKQDMQILNLRNYVDPSDIYRRPEFKEMPKYFEVISIKLKANVYLDQI